MINSENSQLKSSKRVTAAELYRITKKDIEAAIQEYVPNSNQPFDYKDSTRFDLLIGDRRLPPKVIIGIAAKRVFGGVLSSGNFSGGEGSSAFRLLWSHGFEVVTKLHKVGNLDATFSVGKSADTTFLILESMGPSRNTDYSRALIALLGSLRLIEASITDIYLDTSQTRGLSLEKRRLNSDGLNYPISLKNLVELEAFRLNITSATASAGSPDENAEGKRLRFELDLNSNMLLFELASFLSKGARPKIESKKGFSFRPKEPAGSSEHSKRKSQDKTIVTHVHYEMQKKLYFELAEKYGKQCVASEQISAGKPADLVIKSGEGYEIYELKTSDSPRECIRQAIGQLLEYSYWPNSPEYKKLWIVGPSPIDEESSKFLDILRNKFNLPLEYLRQSK
jgi:hypothetical protein